MIGMRPPRTSYRLGKEHEISITRLPFHQTRTLALPRARRILWRSRHVTFNERRTMDETAYRATSFFPSLFRLSSLSLNLSSLSVSGTSRRIFEELVNFFLATCNFRIEDISCVLNFFYDFLECLFF